MLMISPISMPSREQGPALPRRHSFGGSRMRCRREFPLGLHLSEVLGNPS
jgi:hypothetical protein